MPLGAVNKQTLQIPHECIEPEIRYRLLNFELIHHGLPGFSRLKPKQYVKSQEHQMVLIRTPPFGGKLKLELQRRVPHSRVGVKALADLTAVSPSEAGHAET